MGQLGSNGDGTAYKGHISARASPRKSSEFIRTGSHAGSEKHYSKFKKQQQYNMEENPHILRKEGLLSLAGNVPREAQSVTIYGIMFYLISSLLSIFS